MSGAISSGGLISGLDTNTLISQLMSLERQPINRLQDRLSALEAQKTALRSFRTQLNTLRNLAQDFRLMDTLKQYQASSSEEDVVTISSTGSAASTGAYKVEVLQLASATVATSSSFISSPINSSATLSSSGIATDIEAGTFSINGVQFSIDPDTTSLDGVMAQINSSAARVTATYDNTTGKVTFTNNTVGSTQVINFGASSDTSNFLETLNVIGATQTSNVDGTTQVTSTNNIGSAAIDSALGSSGFVSGSVTSGTFYINGVAITVDASTDTLSDVIERVNASDAGVTMSYDTSSDSIRVVSNTFGSRTIGLTSGTSNFLDVMNLTGTTQSVGADAQLKINDGAVLTRSTNEISDAITGVTLSLDSIGTSTVKVSSDDQAIVDSVKEFLEAINTAVSDITELTATDGTLERDSTLQMIQSFLRSTVLSEVSGVSSDYSSLLSIGISTGDSFDSSVISPFELDEEEFLEALSTNRSAVEQLFSNSSDTGIANQIEDYLTSIAGIGGVLEERTKTNGLIDTAITRYNDQIERMEERLEMRETRLRTQFTNMEKMLATYQSQSSSLAALTAAL